MVCRRGHLRYRSCSRNSDVSSAVSKPLEEILQRPSLNGTTRPSEEGHFTFERTTKRLHHLRGAWRGIHQRLRRGATPNGTL